MSWRTRGGLDVPTLAGIGVVAVSAAVLSFASLQALGQRAGYAPGLAALLPIAIDAQAVVATRAWLAAATPGPARRYARGLALTAVALSVIGNAGEHAMSAAGTVAPWWVVVLIAAVPPIALAATAHLGALLATRSTPIDTPAIEAAPVDPAGDVRESTRAESIAPPPARTIDDLRAEFGRALVADGIDLDPASAESIRKALRCSPKRARQLRDEYATRPHLVAVGETN